MLELSEKVKNYQRFVTHYVETHPGVDPKDQEDLSAFLREAIGKGFGNLRVESIGVFRHEAERARTPEQICLYQRGDPRKGGWGYREFGRT